MPSLVITSDTVSVNLESRHIELLRRNSSDNGKRGTRIMVPLFDLERVIICGRPNISVPVLQRLMKQGIPTFFITSKSRWIGSLLPDNNMNAERRIRQYELARDRNFALKVSKKIVLSKIKNSRRVLQRLAANRSLSNNTTQLETCSRLEEIANLSAEARNLDELRGYEGAASAIYFSWLSTFFPETFDFNARSRRPPKDEANALLSWTYAIVLGEVDSMIRINGLDPCIGCLHEISNGRPSLSLDLIEPLRAPLCDMLVLHLVNHQIFKKDDFEFNSDDGGTYMKSESRAKFFIEYEQTMTRKFSPADGGTHVDFRKVIENSVITFLKAMEGNDAFEFFKMP